MSRTRLTLVLSGAIAKGSYHGGALAQIAYAALHERKNGRDVWIDVVSGASAGSMAGAIVAYGLSTKKTQDKKGWLDRADRIAKDLYDAWCGDESSYPGLFQKSPDSAESVLNTEAIETMANRLLGGDSERFLDLDKGLEVYFCCTLTSLAPIPYSFQINSAAGGATNILATTRGDWAQFRFSDDRIDEVGRDLTPVREEDPVDVMRRFRSLALASGRFPFAFAPGATPRWSGIYPKPWGELNEKLFMAYMDGGVINNMPLNRAATIISQGFKSQVKSLTAPCERITVLIEVQSETEAKMAEKLPQKLITVKSDDYGSVRQDLGRVVGPLVEAIQEQGFYEDLHEAQQVNMRLEERKSRLWKVLHQQISDMPDVRVEQGNMGPGTLEALLEHRGSRWQSVHLIEYYKDQLTEAEYGFSGPDAEARLILMAREAALMDVVADLHGKSTISFLRIVPKAPLLSGGMGAFEGFLAKELMQADFATGAQDAFVTLSNLWKSKGWAAPAELAPQTHPFLLGDPRRPLKRTDPNQATPEKIVPNISSIRRSAVKELVGNALDSESSLSRNPFKWLIRFALQAIAPTLLNRD